VEGFDTTNVDSVVDNSFLESNRAVIIHLCDRVWTIVVQFVSRMLACFDEDSVSDGVVMNASRFILAFVIHVDPRVLPLSNVFPVGNVFDIFGSHLGRMLIASVRLRAWCHT
jgi:hypothetical protein